MRVDRVEAVIKALMKAKIKYGKPGNSVIVGYTANYALHVHEMVDKEGLPRIGEGIPRRKPHKGKYWDPQGRGQSKFLEQPFIENRDMLARTVIDTTRATKSLEKGLLVAGLRLQALSQKLVPVDTGNLKASAFTTLDRTSDEAMIISHYKLARRTTAQKERALLKKLKKGSK
jgi:hypothetical protein